jgi:hypothetical protein
MHALETIRRLNAKRPQNLTSKGAARPKPKPAAEPKK